MISEAIDEETMDILRESSDQELHNIPVCSAASAAFLAACAVVIMDGFFNIKIKGLMNMKNKKKQN